MTTAEDASRAAQLRRLAAWYFFYFAFVGAFAPYFTLYLQQIGLSAWQIGLLMSVPQVMRLVAPTVWGWLADHLGRRAFVVRLAAAGTALGFAGYFTTQQLVPLLLITAVVWFFWSAALPLVEAMTLDRLVGQTERYGRIRLWGSVGFIVSVMGLGVLLDHWPIEALLWACLAILTCVLLMAVSLADVKVGAGGTAPPLGRRLRQPAVIALLAACFFMAVAHGPLYVFFSIHLDAHGYDKSLIGLFWSLGVIAEIVVFFYMPRLLKHISLRRILILSFLLAVLRFLLIGWAADAVVLLTLAQLLHGATFGAYHAAAMAILIRWFEPAQQARVQGLYGSLSFGAGGMIGGLVSGQAWQPLGAGATYSLAALCAACGAWLVWRWVDEAALPARPAGAAKAVQ